MMAILKVLEKHQDTILGSREISKQLTMHGIDLTERTVRYHLKILDERGFTKVFGKEGRMITRKGKEELSQALVSDKIGFVISKIETLSYLTSLDLEKNEGEITRQQYFAGRQGFNARLVDHRLDGDFRIAKMPVGIRGDTELDWVLGRWRI